MYIVRFSHPDYYRRHQNFTDSARQKKPGSWAVTTGQEFHLALKKTEKIYLIFQNMSSYIFFRLYQKELIIGKFLKKILHIVRFVHFFLDFFILCIYVNLVLFLFPFHIKRRVIL